MKDIQPFLINRPCPVCNSTKFILINSAVRQTADKFFIDYQCRCLNCGFVLFFSKEITRSQFNQLCNTKFASFKGNLQFETQDFSIETKEDKLKVTKKSGRKKK